MGHATESRRLSSSHYVYDWILSVLKIWAYVFASALKLKSHRNDDPVWFYPDRPTQPNAVLNLASAGPTQIYIFFIFFFKFFPILFNYSFWNVSLPLLSFWQSGLYYFQIICSSFVGFRWDSWFAAIFILYFFPSQISSTQRCTQKYDICFSDRPRVEAVRIALPVEMCLFQMAADTCHLHTHKTWNKLRGCLPACLPVCLTVSLLAMTPRH